MRKMRMLVASLAGAACLVAAVPATTSTASTLTESLTITCHQRPSSCVGVGVLGTLFGETVLTPQGDVAFVCIGSSLFGCNVADAVLEVNPRLIFTGALVLGTGAVLTIAPRFVQLLLLSHSYQVDLVANNGAEGVVVLTPGVHKCLAIVGLTISAPPC
jgi:hypothetical protein